jgi:hypothetical protein
MTTPELVINNGAQVLIQDKNLTITSDTFNSESRTVYTYSTSNQVNKLAGGNYSLTTAIGDIDLIADQSDINLTSSSGDVILKAGDTIFSVSNSGNVEIDGIEIDIGTSNTSNIDFNSSNNITLSTDALTAITTDNIILKSTDGEIILDTSPTTGNNALTIDNSGNIIINGNSSHFGYQLEVNMDNASTGDINKNGISINNVGGYSNISPEVRTVYQNADTSNRVINSMGVYSPNDPANKYREYTGYQYGNQIIIISGEEFNNNDIGRTITFEDDNRATVISNLGTIILPADNTFASSGITLTVGGVYTGSSNKIFIVKIDNAEIGNNTFTWSSDGGSTWIGKFIPLSYATGQRYPLSDGIYITFSSSSGHILNDYWTIQAKQTAIVNSNIIINGSITNDESIGTIVTGVTDNITDTISSTLGAPVFSNITGNIALSRLQTFKTSSSGMVGYFGTSTNNDLVIQSAGEPRFTVTADGSLGIGQDNINGRIQATSNFNKSTLVNGNILNSNIIADNGTTIIGNSNLATNILNYQQNPVSTELNTGGYVVIYESQTPGSTGFDIYGDAFTGNGDKLGSTFRVNLDTEYTQSHPHIAKSGNITSDNYMAVWSSNIGGVQYGIRGQLLTNYSERLIISGDIEIASSGYTPRVTGLTNGNYVITYSIYNITSEKYDICYQIYNSTCTSVIKGETTIASSLGTNYIYPYVVGLSSKDANRPSGFVIAYLKQVYSGDVRYQSVFKLFDADGSNESSEIGITTTSIVNPGDVEANTDLSLSDSMLTLERLPDLISANENGGFMVAYQINYSASVVYSDIVNSGIRNVYSVSGNGNGDLTAASIDPITGIQTLTLSDVNGTFLVDEQIYLVGENGYLTEKIGSISMVGSTATINLSRDPKSIAVARFDSTGTLVWRNNSVSTTPLKLDKELLNLNSRLPEDYLREGTNQYAYRSIPIIKSNNNNIIISWNNGELPSIYYQLLSITTGNNTGNEYLLGREIIGLCQVNPWISSLNTRQGISLGYSICYNTCSMDLSKTAIYQELIGVDSYIAHFANKQVDFVIDNNGKLGLGTTNPEATVHIKTQERLQTSNNTDTCSMLLENGTNGIITNSDSHRMSFKDNDGVELARISVKYSNNYQSYTNNELVAYFKFDEVVGEVLAKDYGIYNIQSNTASDTSGNKIQDAQLIDFDVNNCWVKGKINGGLEFNGSTSYLKIPTDNNLSSVIRSIDTITTDSFSISFWFKINGEYVLTNTEMDILSYGTDIVGTADGGFFQLYFRDIDSTGSLKTCFKWVETVGGTVNEVTTSSKVNDNEWHHLVVIHTRDSIQSNMKIYLDNTNLLNSDLGAYINSTQSITDRNIYIGAGINGSSNYFRGILDEFRVYRSVLTIFELEELWKYGNENRSQISIQTAGDNTNYSSNGPGLTIDDTGKIISARIKNQVYFTLTGTIIATVDSKTLTGIDTLFLQEVKPGDVLYIDNIDSSLETGGIYTDTLNQRQYIINEVISNTELIINRIIPDVTTTRYFQRVTVRPAITSLFDVNNSLKGFMDYYGDLVIGEAGKSAIEYAKMEIRGTGEEANNKNGLLLTNTSTTTLNTDGARINRLITQSSNSSGSTEVLQSMITSSHSGTSNDDKSKIQFWINDGTATTNITDLKSPLTIYDNSSVNFGQTEQRNNLLGDIHLRGQTDSTASIAIFSEKAAEGTYTEDSELVFYGVDSINSTYSDSRALAKIKVSNDNPNPPNEQLVNGRIDLQVNNEVGSSLKGLKTRMAITADGSVGIHNIRPLNPLSANPEFIDVGELINSATITEYTSSTRLLTFDTSDTMFNTSSNAALLRNGVLVINTGSNVVSYSIDNGITSTLNPTQYQITLSSTDSGVAELSDNDGQIIGQEFTIYYPGLQVNKYGLVGIGDASFNDNNVNYHLSVSGSSVFKGELNLSSNISVSDINSNIIGIKANSSNEKIQIKDSTTNEYINLISGPLTSAIIETTINRTLDWATDSTIIVNNNTDTLITLPTPSIKYKGYIFTIKNTSSTGNITIYPLSSNIDGSSSNIEITTQNDVNQFQTDGVNWYKLSPIVSALSGSGNTLSDSSLITITAPIVDINASTEVNINNNLKIGGKLYLGGTQTELEISELGTTNNLIFETTTNNKNLVFTHNIDSTSNTEILQIGNISGTTGLLVSDTIFFNDTTSNISSSTVGNLDVSASNILINGTNINLIGTSNITGTLTVSDTSTFGSTVFFNDSTANISSLTAGNLDISASNINLTGSIEVNNTIKMNKKIIKNIDTIETTSTNPSSRIELISSTNDASVKSIILTDTASNGSILYYNCNIGSEMGECLNIFYYNANISGTANIDFGASNIYGGDGSGRFLEFVKTGQSAQLMFIDNIDTNIKGWRIINSGANFY